MITVDLSQEQSLDAARKRLNAAEWRAKSARMKLSGLGADASQADRLSAQREAEAATNLHAIAMFDVQRLLAGEQRRAA